MKARQFCGPEENVFRFIACEYRDLAAGRYSPHAKEIVFRGQSAGYFQTLFSQNKLLPKVQP